MPNDRGPLMGLLLRWLATQRSALGLTLRLGLVVVALQLPSWLLQFLNASASADERPLFNLDLLLAAVVACFSTGAGAILIILAWGADLMRAVAKNYHFLSAVDLLDAARFADLVNLGLFLRWPALVGALVLTVCCIVVLRLARGQRGLAVAVLGTAVLLQAVDVVNGSFSHSGFIKDRRHVDINVAGSPAWNIYYDQLSSPLATGELKSLQGVESYPALLEWHATHPDRSALLVLVESMGMPRNPELKEWLAGRLMTPAVLARWHVRSTSEPFIGATTSGELRTLCGLQGHYSRLTAETARGCMPAKLQADGRETIGLHGFHLRMFDRRDWWPKIGLTPWNSQTLNAEQLHMDCNAAFRGICDGTLLHEAVQRTESPRRFVYALTLDTHLPLDNAHPLPPVLMNLCARSNTSPAACQLVGRLGEVLSGLESELASSSGTAMVVVAGDHAPPFAEPQNRLAFEDGQVPVFILEPIR